VVSSLLRKYNIDPRSIGRLEVGTESPIDKAKSVKSVLTTLFEPSGNTSLEGIDTIHACYGGTNALFNAVNWVESRSWDGRDAIVVTSDIAIYNQHASRPTGGAGAVAMLVGPNAPLALDPTLRGIYMTNTFDFYKPDMKVEYPIVNGHESLVCYTRALDGCHRNLLERLDASKHNKAQVNGTSSSSSPKKVVDLFDYMAFHTPNCKLVSKSYGRLKYDDCLSSPNDEAAWEGIPAELRALSYQDSLRSKELEKVLVALTRDRFRERVEPCIAAPSRCGNMYTSSLYCSLISLISNIDLAQARGKTIGLFSYGSGAASALFGMRITGDLSEMVEKIDLMARLERRHVATAEEYEEVRTTPVCPG
jgi:hydroxymethylglutaryl-CoA synthase